MAILLCLIFALIANLMWTRVQSTRMSAATSVIRGQEVRTYQTSFGISSWLTMTQKEYYAPPHSPTPFHHDVLWNTSARGVTASAIITAITLMGLAIVWRTLTRALKPFDVCDECGYSLIGLEESALCPECGAQLPPQARAYARRSLQSQA